MKKFLYSKTRPDLMLFQTVTSKVMCWIWDAVMVIDKTLKKKYFWLWIENDLLKIDSA